MENRLRWGIGTALIFCALFLPIFATAAPVEVPPATDEAMRYYWSGNYLYIVRILWGLFVPAVVLFTGLGARIAKLAERIAAYLLWPVSKLAGALDSESFIRLAAARYGQLLVQTPVNFILVILIIFVVDLPLEYYGGYVRQHEYGLSNQELSRWIEVLLINTAVIAAIGALVIWVPYLLLTKAPRTWWLWTGILLCPFIFLLAFIVPIYIDPLLHEYGEMKDKDLERSILALAERSGIEGSRVFEVNMSEDTKQVNAYVTGLSNTKRIVLWDTIIEKLDEDELLFVMGHEMGHFVLNHVIHGVLLTSASLLIGLFASHIIAGFIMRRFGARIGFTELAHPASIWLLLLLMQIMGLIAQPVGLAYSRHIEHESDRFGLELTHSNQAAAEAFVKLQTENLANPYPGPIYTFFRASHPPIGHRVEFMNEYTPWETGDPQEYVHLFDAAEELPEPLQPEDE